MTHFQDLVSEFNRGVGAGRDPKLRAELIREEADETAKAIRDENIVETLDGLCDVLYVVYGAADVFGFRVDTYAYRIGPSLSPLGFMGARYFLGEFTSLAAKAYNGTLEEDLTTMLGSYEDLARLCFIIASQCLGVNLKPFFLEVHRTNMLKLDGPVRADGKRLKPEGWKPPRIAEIYAEMKGIPVEKETR